MALIGARLRRPCAARRRTAPSPRARLLLCLPLGALLAVPAPATSQTGPLAPVFLEPDHWTYDALRRLAGAGIAPAAADPALAPVTLRHARRVFAFARDSAARRDRPEFAGIADGYLRRLTREAPERAGALAGLRLRGGAARYEGSALTGQGYHVGEDFTGAQPLENRTHPLVLVRGHGYVGTRLAWSAEGGAMAGEALLRSAALSAALGPLDLWAGRRQLHYGIGRTGATVLGSGLGHRTTLDERTLATIDGLGVHTREPFRFPWYFRALGPMRIEIVASRLARNGRVERPYAVFGRMVGQPFSRRFTLGVNRGAIFGGTGNPITLDRLLGLLVGVHGGQGGEFENQVIAGVMRFRPPLGPLPVELFFEFGSDDTAGAWRDVPGLIMGLDLAAVPGLPTLALAVEHTQFSGVCCGNTQWYRNIFFRGSWGDEGRLFAHPLGGHGREWLVAARLDLRRWRTHVDVDAFHRVRHSENLFAPERRGESRGASLRVSLEAARRFDVTVAAGLEDGTGWSLHGLQAFLTFYAR